MRRPRETTALALLAALCAAASAAPATAAASATGAAPPLAGPSAGPALEPGAAAETDAAPETGAAGGAAPAEGGDAPGAQPADDADAAPAGAGAGRRAPRRRPRLRIALGRRQPVLRHGAVLLRARCRIACRVEARGALRLGGRRFPLRPTSQETTRRKGVLVVVQLRRRARLALRRALRSGRPARAVVRVRAHSAGGRSRPLLATVRVRG